MSERSLKESLLPPATQKKNDSNKEAVASPAATVEELRFEQLTVRVALATTPKGTKRTRNALAGASACFRAGNLSAILGNATVIVEVSC